MKTIHYGTAEKPLDDPELARQAFSVLDRAWAMGLLPMEGGVDPVSLTGLTLTLAPVRKAGIGKASISQLARAPRRKILPILRRINEALEGSPNPDSEWERMVQVLGAELLSRLIGVSTITVARYKSKSRKTPPGVAARLHFLAMIVADLAGSYNSFGIVRWFERPRHQLGGKSPMQCLSPGWSPDSGHAIKIKDLAEAISGAVAT
jgi:hypothetical protein